jgi:hypothetical protein
MWKRLYSEQRKKPNEQRTKLNGRKRTHKLRGNQRQRQSVSSPMRKLLERPPKGDAKALPKANPVWVRGCESGSGVQDSNCGFMTDRIEECELKALECERIASSLAAEDDPLRRIYEDLATKWREKARHLSADQRRRNGYLA